MHGKPFLQIQSHLKVKKLLLPYLEVPNISAKRESCVFLLYIVQTLAITCSINEVAYIIHNRCSMLTSYSITRVCHESSAANSEFTLQQQKFSPLNVFHIGYWKCVHAYIYFHCSLYSLKPHNLNYILHSCCFN